MLPFALVCLLGACLAVLPAAEIAEAADLGRWRGTGTTTESLTPTTAGIRLSGRLYTMAGGLRGFAVLGRFGPGGPGTIGVTWRSEVPTDEAIEPFCLLRVVAPDGELVGLIDLAAVAEDGTATGVLNVPCKPGCAGTWRISVIGGRHNDRACIELPPTDTWAIRGEMALAAAAGWPFGEQGAFLYVPGAARKIMIEQLAGSTPIVVCHAGAALCQATTFGRKGRRMAVVETPPRDTVLHLELPDDAVIAVDGVPGLLCPTPAAARALQGDTRVVAGMTVAGPLQARARAWMVAQRAQDLDVDLSFPDPARIDAVADPRREALLYGRYAPLSTLAAGLAAQVLDPHDPAYGSLGTADPAVESWQNFLYPGVRSPFAASALATAVAAEGELNPAHGNAVLARRAALAGLYHVVASQGDDLLRERTLLNRSTPITHAFFIYPAALAKAYLLLRDHLDPTARAIYDQAVQAVGDRLANWRGYQSNQWAHVLLGHLHAHVATGQPRFRRYFERGMRAYLAGAFGPDAKHGRHPAGYYLEQYGPDGNYDHLNGFCVAAAWHAYQRLEDPDAGLLTALRTAISENLHFKSLHWLPRPGGGLTAPNAFNCRTTGLLSSAGWPADHLAQATFPLARARYLFTAAPSSGGGIANLFAYLANDDDWARAVLHELLPQGASAYDAGTVGGGEWVWELHEAWGDPVAVEPASLPARAGDATFELPGMIAWKRGRLYGNVFYTVAGHDPARPPPGHFGGGPATLWTAATGPAVLGRRTTHAWGAVREAADATHACVIANTADGDFWASGHDPAQLERTGSDSWVVHETLATGGSLRWDYQADRDSLRMRVSLTSVQMEDARVNLPVFVVEPDHELALTDGAAVFSVGGTTLRWAATDGRQPELTAALVAARGHIRALRWPLASDGEPLILELEVD
ncbi:MAG: hypothetical protein ACOCYP_06830 [Planctomycetota bacterium]